MNYNIKNSIKEYYFYDIIEREIDEMNIIFKRVLGNDMRLDLLKEQIKMSKSELSVRDFLYMYNNISDFIIHFKDSSKKIELNETDISNFLNKKGIHIYNKASEMFCHHYFIILSIYSKLNKSIISIECIRQIFNFLFRDKNHINIEVKTKNISYIICFPYDIYIDKIISNKYICF